MTRAAKAKTTKGGALVWRLVDHTEPPEDVRIGRQGPLLYAQNPVTPMTEESATLLSKLDRLTRREDGLRLEGGWVRLVRSACRHTYAYRPFIVNVRHEPATTEDIATEILFCEVAEGEQILTELEAMHLIEKVPVPDWAAREGEGKQRTRTAKKKAAATGQSRQKKARVRTNPDKSGQVRTLNKRESEIEDNRKGTEKKTKKIEGEGISKGSVRQRKNHPAPTTAPPMTPANPDAGAGPLSRGRKACPTSIPTLGGIIKLSKHRYDSAAWAFADGVLMASGYREPDNARRECERAHWAKAWSRAAAEFSPDVLARLKRRIIEAAAGIHGRRGDYRNPEAYLLRAFQNDLKDARRPHRSRGAG